MIPGVIVLVIPMIYVHVVQDVVGLVIITIVSTKNMNICTVDPMLIIFSAIEPP